MPRSWMAVVGVGVVTFLPLPASSGGQSAPMREGMTAPDFTLTDVRGKRHTLSAVRPRPTVLFFFCGCEACYLVGQEWAGFQRGGALPGKPDARPQTLLLYHDVSVSGAKSLAESCGVDPKQTTVLTETTGKPSLRQRYAVSACPSVFVVDGKGKIRYVHRAADAEKTDPAATAFAALDAVRALTDAPTRKGKQP